MIEDNKEPRSDGIYQELNHDRKLRLEPSQGFNPARVEKNQLENGQH